MALPTKRSRKIKVDGEDYRWAANGNDYGIDVYVELAKEPTQLLQALASYEYDAKQNQLAVTSRHIEHVIEIA